MQPSRMRGEIVLHYTGSHLTPAEAKELANRLLKEAAEVEFATKCNEAVQS